jgi:hypothetical protein
MEQEIANWTPFDSTVQALPEIWQTTVQNLLSEGNTLINGNPAFSESQPISGLLLAVMEANDDFRIKKCWPLKIVQKQVYFDAEHSRFVYPNKYGRNTVLKPEQVRQCIEGTLRGHVSGCPIKKEDFENYLKNLSDAQKEKHNMNDLLEHADLI